MKKITPIAGIFTCIILYAVIIIAAIPYVGQQGESYSVFNHFISELGSLRFSVNQAIYNNGVVASAFGFGTFTYGVMSYVQTKVVKIGVGIGVLSSMFCVGVGLVPEESRILHLTLAVSFFSLMAIAVTMISWSILKEKENPFPKYLGIHGFLVSIAFVLFMSMPKGLMAIKRAEGPLFYRPTIWWLPFFEWIIFILLTSWILVVSIKMIQLEKEQS